MALIGRVGSGKSTIQRLIMGLYQPTDGAVLLDGIDLRQLDPADVRRGVGCVSQDVLLFYGSLRENITLGLPYADDSAIVAAADTAGLTDFVNRHPRGFDMPVGERGDSLSGGQRQCVGLARALLHNAPVLLLDEPTSRDGFLHRGADHAAHHRMGAAQDRGAGDASHLAAVAGDARDRDRRRQGGGRRPARPHHGSAADRPHRAGRMMAHDSTAPAVAPKPFVGAKTMGVLERMRVGLAPVTNKLLGPTVTDADAAEAGVRSFEREADALISRQRTRGAQKIVRAAARRAWLRCWPGPRWRRWTR